MRLLLLLFLLAPRPSLAQPFSFETSLMHARESATPNASSRAGFDRTSSTGTGVEFTFRSPVIGFPWWLGRFARFEREGWEFYDFFEAQMLLGAQTQTRSRGPESASMPGQYQAYTFRAGAQAIQYQKGGYLHLRGGVQKMLSERHIYNSDPAVSDIENRWEPYVVVGRNGVEVGAGTGGYLMLELRSVGNRGLYWWFVRAERHAQKLSGSDNDGLYFFAGLGGGF